jgi:hypothetical protein
LFECQPRSGVQPGLQRGACRVEVELLRTKVEFEHDTPQQLVLWAVCGALKKVVEQGMHQGRSAQQVGREIDEAVALQSPLQTVFQYERNHLFVHPVGSVHLLQRGHEAGGFQWGSVGQAHARKSLLANLRARCQRDDGLVHQIESTRTQRLLRLARQIEYAFPCHALMPHAVAPGLLGLVERKIGSLQHLFERVATVGRCGAHPRADRQRNGLTSLLQFERLHLGANALGYRDGLFERGVR